MRFCLDTSFEREPEKGKVDDHLRIGRAKSFLIGRVMGVIIMNIMKVEFPNNEMVDMEYGRPIVLLGANGAGKTRLSIKIEEINDPAFQSNNQLESSRIHRISAQKSLTIPAAIPIYDHESSQKNLFIGNSEDYASKSVYRYQSNPATCMINDYDQALSLLFSEAHRELECEHNEAKKCDAEGKVRPKLSDTVVDRAQRIWNSLLPHRIIDLSRNGVHVHFNNEQYLGREMSDGERVMLYMICQALVVKPNSLFIIDEPELHIHKAIVKELWTQLENERPDCIFMYLTHDIDFALSRKNAQYLWIKSFDGSNWEYEFLDIDSYPDFPSELLLEILGMRQKIVFVEGTKDSCDYQLYQEIYREKGYHVIPCGGCQDVIRLVKAKKSYEKLQLIEVCGIIDRDYRCDREIQALRKDGIYTLEVAEVENLFIVPAILEIMSSFLGSDPEAANEAKRFIVDMYNRCKERQIAESLSKEISHQLSLFDIGHQQLTDTEIYETISNCFTLENIGSWRAEKEAIFNSANTLDEILAVFNCKKLSHAISSKYGLSDSDFPKRVLNILSQNKNARGTILKAISAYVPELP